MQLCQMIFVVVVAFTHHHYFKPPLPKSVYHNVILPLKIQSPLYNYVLHHKHK